MNKTISALWIVIGLMGWQILTVQGALAQDQVWLQVEAQPNLRDAQSRARAYATELGDVAGFRLSSGWYAIVLGPVARDEAPDLLSGLVSDGRVPSDSFLADASNFRQQFWPVGGAALGPRLTPTPAPAQGLGEPEPEPANILTTAVPATEVAALPLETPAEARRAEAALAVGDRQLLQTALKWFGFYASAVDGAFGPGTRKAMGDWQAERGFEVTGILTSAERQSLTSDYQADLAAIGLQKVREDTAGIEIDLPLAMVSFDHYDPPFVHYKEKAGSGMSVLLISQAGDQNTLFGLYDLMQTLQIVPPEGERSREDDSFTLTGQNVTLKSHTYAALNGGLIKGYTLIWRPEDETRAARILAAMQSSFTPFGGRAMDDSIGNQTEEQRRGLLAGLEVRRPDFSRSGFYVDESGLVLTTGEAVGNCARITLDGAVEADLLLSDPASGVALLKPRAALSPQSFAEFQMRAPRLQSEVAVAGYSYEDQLTLPTLTFGTLEDLRGLNGETGVDRLAVEVLPGDAGGPVLDSSGAVLGLLLPRQSGNRVLPDEVNYAVDVAAIQAVLAASGLTVAESTRQGSMPAQELSLLASKMTVLVSCWN